MSMTGAQIREMIDRVKAADAAGKITPEQKDQYLSVLNDAMTHVFHAPSFAESMSTMGTDPFSSGMNAIVEGNRKAGVPIEHTANMMMKGVGQAVDLGTLAGPTRMAAGQIAGAKYSAKDVADALLNGFPSGADIVSRNNSSKDIAANPNLSAVKATAYDLLDPAVLTGLGGVVKEGVQDVGRNVFSRGIRALEEEAVRNGKVPGELADTMLRNKVYGNNQGIAARSQAAQAKLGPAIDAAAQAADQAGAKVPKFATELESLRDDLDKIIAGKDEAAAQAATQAKDLLDKQIGRIQSSPASTQVSQAATGLVDSAGNPIMKDVETVRPAVDNTPNVSETIGIKRSLRNNLNSNAYDTLAKTSEGQKVLKKMSNLAQKTSEEAIGNTLGQDASSKFIQDNRDFGNLATVDDKLDSLARREAAKPTFSQVDAMAAAVDPTAFVAKQAIKGANSSRFLTTLGYGMNQTPLADILAAATTGAAKQNAGAIKDKGAQAVQSIYKFLQAKGLDPVAAQPQDDEDQ